MRLDRPLDPDLKRIFQQATERTYDDFVGLVAVARGMDAGSVFEVAEGRVWSGSQAQKHGLVDSIGTLQQSIDAAARLAGLGTDYTTRYDEWELTPFEAMLMEMVGGVMAYFDLSLSAPPFVAQGLLGDILEDLRFLAGSNEGLTVAAHCLCESQ